MYKVYGYILKTSTSHISTNFPLKTYALQKKTHQFLQLSAKCPPKLPAVPHLDKLRHAPCLPPLVQAAILQENPPKKNPCKNQTKFLWNRFQMGQC